MGKTNTLKARCLDVIAILFVFLISGMIAFFHVHWIAYSLEAHHMDYAGTVPPAIVIVVDIILLAIAFIRQKKTGTNAKKFLIAVLLVILICSVYAYIFSFNAFCPMCNEVHDKWYMFFYKLIKGRAYEPI